MAAWSPTPLLALLIAVLLLVVANSHKAHAHSGLRHYVRDAALPWAFCVSPKRGM